MVKIYILKCINNKYYIGRTNNIFRRINEHLTQYGSSWTTKYKPIKIKEIDNCDIFDEDKYTLKMMAQYGISNVRGGTFTRITLTPKEKNFIRKMIWNATDKCFKCGSTKHFSKTCHKTFLKNNLKILLNDILSICYNIDKHYNGFIEISQYLNILYKLDPIIFSGITVNHLSQLNNYNEKVNYNNFTVDLIYFLNRY